MSWGTRDEEGVDEVEATEADEEESKCVGVDTVDAPCDVASELRLCADCGGEVEVCVGDWAVCLLSAVLSFSSAGCRLCAGCWSCGSGEVICGVEVLLAEEADVAGRRAPRAAEERTRTGWYEGG